MFNTQDGMFDFWKKSGFVLFILTLTMVASVGTAIAQGKQVTDDKTLDKLKKFRTDFARSMIEQKPEMVQSYLAENIKLMPEFERTISGKSNALTYYKVFSTYFDVEEYSRTENNILDMDSLIFEMGTFSMNLTVKSSGKKIDVKGKYINIWGKTGKAGLLLLTDAWNYNAQPTVEEKVRFAAKPQNKKELWKSKFVNHNSFEIIGVSVIPGYVPPGRFLI